MHEREREREKERESWIEREREREDREPMGGEMQGWTSGPSGHEGIHPEK